MSNAVARDMARLAASRSPRTFPQNHRHDGGKVIGRDGGNLWTL